MPIPKANPEYFDGLIPQFFRTVGSIIPQPKISRKPVFLHTLHPPPEQMLQLTSTSAEGSVKGKYEGRSRIFDFLPNIS